MKLLLLLSLFSFVGCATKYILPANRFITPESQGGILRGSFELQATKGHEAKFDTSSGSASDGVVYNKITRTGYLLQNSIADQFDLYWSHTGGSTSLFGGKFQFLGASRSGKGTGHKMAAAFGFGGNEHDPEDKVIKTFAMKAQEFLLLYGFRFSENVMPYTSLSYTKYDMDVEMGSGAGSASGQEVKSQSKMKGLSGGVEVSYAAWLSKLEYTAQMISTDRTKDKTVYVLGYSVGYSW